MKAEFPLTVLSVRSHAATIGIEDTTAKISGVVGDGTLGQRRTPTTRIEDTASIFSGIGGDCAIDHSQGPATAQRLEFHHH